MFNIALDGTNSAQIMEYLEYDDMSEICSKKIFSISEVAFQHFTTLKVPKDGTNSAQIACSKI